MGHLVGCSGLSFLLRICPYIPVCHNKIQSSDSEYLMSNHICNIATHPDQRNISRQGHDEMRLSEWRERNQLINFKSLAITTFRCPWDHPSIHPTNSPWFSPSGDLSSPCSRDHSRPRSCSTTTCRSSARWTAAASHAGSSSICSGTLAVPDPLGRRPGQSRTLPPTRHCYWTGDPLRFPHSTLRCRCSHCCCSAGAVAASRKGTLTEISISHFIGARVCPIRIVHTRNDRSPVQVSPCNTSNKCNFIVVLFPHLSLFPRRRGLLLWICVHWTLWHGEG